MERHALLFTALSLLALTCATAQQQASQVSAALQQLSRSPQYAQTVQLITGNQNLLSKFTASPLMGVAFADPTGSQYVLTTFGSPIYREILSNPQTAEELAASPALAAFLATSTGDAPTKLGQLLTTGQIAPTGNAQTDFRTLEAGLTQIAGTLAPGPAPVPAPASLRSGGLATAGKK